ncbi:MAG: phage Gp37/Gp68 family protein [Anaerolineales bacterium]|nr:MAG: phage Gp37/Gp68 family protein [Anaerolineales bacterium]
MAGYSAIEWTEATWNPVTGCTKVSAGCQNCYAERMSHRLKAMGQPNYIDGFKVKTHKSVLSLPLKWKKPHKIFVNSMSDLFHEDLPTSFISDVFKIMCVCPQHTFQILTKRSKNLGKLSHSLPWPDNVWIGVTVENSDYLRRIDDLRVTPARIKFISFEPLLGSIPCIDLTNIDWVIVGGESGPGARPMSTSWVEEIRDQCSVAGIPFFFKQWGGFNKKKAGRLLDGRTWDDMPAIYKKRELGAHGSPVKEKPHD